MQSVLESVVGKKVHMLLNTSLPDRDVRGLVEAFDSSWIRIKTDKKTMIVPISAILYVEPVAY